MPAPVLCFWVNVEKVSPKQPATGLRRRRLLGAGASDRTKYGSTRASARSFMVHHTQRISLAAVKYDALAIRKKMLSKKQKLAAHAAPTDGAWA